MDRELGRVCVIERRRGEKQRPNVFLRKEREREAERKREHGEKGVREECR